MQPNISDLSGPAYHLKNCSIMACLVGIYLAAWFLQIGNRFSLFGAIRFEFVLGAFLSAASLLKLFSSKEDNPSAFKFMVSLWIFYAFLVFFGVISYDRSQSWHIFIERVFKFSLVALFVAAWGRNKSDLIVILFGFFLAMLKIIQEGYFGIATGGLIWENQGIPRLHGVTLLFAHPNSLSGLAVSALPFFIFLFRFQPWYLKLIFLVGIFGLLLIILYTGSRTGYLATFILFFAAVYRLGLLRFKTLLILASVAIASAIFVPDEYKGRLMTIFQSEEERGGSANKRLEIIEDAIQIAFKYPLGIGLQAFPHVREMEFGRGQDTHNLYLEVLTNLGIFGFIAFIFFIYHLFKLNLKSRKIFAESGQIFLAELCVIVNLYILCRLALGMFGMDLYEIYWWFAAGFTIALARIANQTRRKLSHDVSDEAASQ